MFGSGCGGPVPYYMRSRHDNHASVVASLAPAAKQFKPVAGTKREVTNGASEEGETGNKALVHI